MSTNRIISMKNTNQTVPLTETLKCSKKKKRTIPKMKMTRTQILRKMTRMQKMMRKVKKIKKMKVWLTNQVVQQEDLT